jgi:hypothetical protein
MSSLLAVLRSGSSERRRSRHATLLTGLVCLSVLGLGLAAPALAAPTITLGAGVVNPPPNKQTTALNPQQTAIADKATLIPVATFGPTFQSLLTAEGYSNANNWFLNTNTATLANNATFNITDYKLTLNPGGNGQFGLPDGTAAGSAFGENIDFTLNPNLAQPGNLPNGSTATVHWLQIFNASTATANGHAGVQLAAPNNVGYWYIDNGFVSGTSPPTGAGGVAPYYDSNGGLNIVPPTFGDTPSFFSGVGYFLHFQVVPVWDVFVPAQPAQGGNPAVPASETMYVADYGVAWGFRVVPEPSSITIMVFGIVTFVGIAWKRKK